MYFARTTFIAAVFSLASVVSSSAYANTQAATSSVLGSTPAQINSRFTSIIELNVQRNPSVIDRMTDQELADLAYVYASTNDGNVNLLLKIFARKLSPAALVRITPYFGPENTRRTVASYAKPSVAQAYEALVSSRLESRVSVSASLMNPTAAPTIDMTPYEIYLEFRTAPIGSLTPGSALAETGMFMATKLSIAAGTGWVIGSGINELIETYDPELDDKIGGTIDAALTNISDARSSLQQGKYEEALDKVFGGSITDEGDKTGDYSGDYDVSESYDRYNEWDDKCDPRIEDCR